MTSLWENDITFQLYLTVMFHCLSSDLFYCPRESNFKISDFYPPSFSDPTVVLSIDYLYNPVG